jgi:hypothetical protein
LRPKGGGDACGDEGGTVVDAGGRQDAGVDHDDVGHGEPGGQAGEELGARGGGRGHEGQVFGLRGVCEVNVEGGERKIVADRQLQVGGIVHGEAVAADEGEEFRILGGAIDDYAEAGECAQKSGGVWGTDAAAAFVHDERIPYLEPPNGRHNGVVSADSPER